MVTIINHREGCMRISIESHLNISYLICETRCRTCASVSACVWTMWIVFCWFGTNYWEWSCFTCELCGQSDRWNNYRLKSTHTGTVNYYVCYTIAHCLSAFHANTSTIHNICMRGVPFALACRRRRRSLARCLSNSVAVRRSPPPLNGSTICHDLPLCGGGVFAFVWEMHDTVAWDMHPLIVARRE